MNNPATNVLVIADCSGGNLSRMSRELLAQARALADPSGGRVGLLFFGVTAESLCKDAAAAGADSVYDCIEARIQGYQPDVFEAAALAAYGKATPRVILMAHGPLGVDLAPRLAFRLGVRWATQCIAVHVEGEEIVCRRNEIGGKIQAVESISGSAVVTLRPMSVDLPVAQGVRECSTIPIHPASATASPAILFVERKVADAGASRELEQADIIVTGGLGVGSPDGFESLRKLANALGGSLGASKQAVDRGWVPAERQVGLTGITVAPKLYLAVGVSGALQHMAGCQKSKTIVAINSDPDAPIFRFAQYGVVGKWEELVPELLSRLSGAAVQV